MFPNCSENVFSFPGMLESFMDCEMGWDCVYGVFGEDACGLKLTGKFGGNIGESGGVDNWVYLKSGCSTIDCERERLKFEVFSSGFEELCGCEGSFIGWGDGNNGELKVVRFDLVENELSQIFVNLFSKFVLF